MCFSASASFGAGAVLAVAGIVTLKKANATNAIAFGAIPFIFAVQQFSEGFSWLALSEQVSPSWHQIPSYIFLFFSHIVWPTWMPLSLFLIEKDSSRMKILGGFLLLGCLLASYHLYFIITKGVEGEIIGCHIDYFTHFPGRFSFPASFLYGLTTIVPFFLSGVKRMYLFGLGLILAYFVSKVFYVEYLISVFCFFAALLSVIIWYILSSIDNPG